MTFGTIVGRAASKWAAVSLLVGRLCCLCVLAIGVVGSSALAQSADSAPQRNYYFGRTTDSTRVVITMMPKGVEPTRFDIPRSYLTFSPTWHGGVQDTVVIEFLLSTFSPLSESGRSLNDKDAIVINLISRGKWITAKSTQDTINRNIHDYWKKIREADMTFDVYVEYRDIEKLKAVSAIFREYYVPLNKTGHESVYFSCLRELGNKETGCTGHSTFAPGILLDYQFRRSRLEEWRTIDKAVRKLLNRFALNRPLE